MAIFNFMMLARQLRYVFPHTKVNFRIVVMRDRIFRRGIFRRGTVRRGIFRRKDSSP